MNRRSRRSERKKSPSSRGTIASKKLPLISFLLILGGLAAAMLYVASPWKTPPAADHTNAKLVDMGRRIYGAECASCHGQNLEGQQNWRARLPNGKLPAPPHNASGHTWHHSDQALFDITQKGPAAYPSGYQTDMPAFGDRLSNEQIAAVVAFIKSTWPPEILRRQPKPGN